MVNPYAYAQPPQRQIESVTGRQSAEAYQLAPNSSAILLDSTRDRFYVVRSDASGYRTVEAYDFVKAATAGDVGIQAVLGGQAVPGAVSTGHSAANGEDAPLSLDFLVRVGGCPVVSPVPATLAVQATQAQEVSACSVTVERVAWGPGEYPQRIPKSPKTVAMRPHRRA